MNAKIVSSTKLRENLAEVLNSVDKNQLCIVTRSGKQKYALLDLDKLEDLLAASNPEYLKVITTARQQAIDGEVFTLEEVFGNI